LAFGLGIWLSALLILPGISGGSDQTGWWGPLQTIFRVIAWLLQTDLSPAFFQQAVEGMRTLGLVTMLVGWFGSGVAAQIYRYRNVSDPLEKKQTRSVVFGMGLAVAAAFFYYLVPVFLPQWMNSGALHLAFQTLSMLLFSVFLILAPVFLVIAVLRYQLWEVDALINRTLVYILLTGLIGLIYIVGVVVFQSVFRAATGQGSEIVIVVTTLVLAAVFSPLRDRVQNFIDRRFYREKVDVRRVFTEFGRELRTLIDLSELEKTLVLRVADLLHIRYGAVFLKQPAGGFELAAAHNLPGDPVPQLPSRPGILERLTGGGIEYRPSASPFPLLVPLISPRAGGSNLVGILALGPRLSGEQYSREDQSLLLGLADQAGTAIRVAQLIEARRADAEQRRQMEEQLAAHWNSPHGRAEAAAAQITAHPERALQEFHRLAQAAGDDPDSAALAENLPRALEGTPSAWMARLAEGYRCLLAGPSDPEMIPVGLRILAGQLQDSAAQGRSLAGAETALEVYSAAQAALSVRTLGEIAGWEPPRNGFDSEPGFLSDLAGMLSQLRTAADSLRAYERVDTAQDKLAYLAAAIERLNRLHLNAGAELGSADRPVIRRIAERWMAVATGAMGELQSRAQIVCALLTRHTWQNDVVTAGFSIRNSGRGAAVNLKIRLLSSAEYEAGEETNDVEYLGPGSESLVEFRIRPLHPKEAHRMRVCIEILYTDPRGADLSENFADTVELMETIVSFRPVINPYVVGIPLQAGSPLFFGREDILAFIREHLGAAHRNNLVLIGQRRTGKSSLLKQLPNRLTDEFMTVYLDGQALGLDSGLAAFLHSIATEIAYAMTDRGLRIAPPVPGFFTERPASTFERKFLPEVHRLLKGRHLLLLLDEFEALETAVRGGSLDAAIFPFLRHLIQHSTDLSVIFCGTHRLEELASDYWNVLFNISLYRHVGFLDRGEAMRLIQEPVAGGGLHYDDLALEKIWRVTAGHPYFLQLICHNLVNRQNRAQRNYVTVADVNAALDEILTTGEAHFIYLWMESTPEQKLALFALAQSAGAGTLTPIQAADNLLDRGVILERPALAEAFRTLVARDILTSVSRPDLPAGEAFGWKLGLLGMWVEKCKTLGRVLEETQIQTGGRA
jgi:hypothetical protein